MAYGTAPRKYYSTRTGVNPNGSVLSLDSLKTLFMSAYREFSSRGYLAEYFGFYCVDQGEVAGKIGADIPNYMLFHIRKANLWPVAEHINEFSEHDLFDLIEFLYDHISKPTKGELHSYGDCGTHWTKFDDKPGKADYRVNINNLLLSYGDGYELTSRGEVMGLGPQGIVTLYEAELPNAEKAVSDKVQTSVDRFRRYGSTVEDRHGAVRDLADVLEFLRAKIKTVLLKPDEADLFTLANKFGIRHFNESQKREYDRSIWLSWMFYHYLATIHAVHHLMQRQTGEIERAALLRREEIRTKAVMHEVVGRYMKLVPAGREQKGCCPFHGEKTPSFYINDVKQFYHCFGCAAHGDVVDFLAAVEGITLGQAAARLSIELDLSQEVVVQ
jgi:hypothetical protein